MAKRSRKQGTKRALRAKATPPAKKVAARAAGTGSKSRAQSTRRTSAATQPSASASSAAATPRSEVAGDLLRFASKLRSNAGEALRFVGDKVQKKLAAPATLRTQTRFVTKAGQLSQQFRDRNADFSTLNTRCRPADPCRPLIDDLEGGGLPRSISVVADEMAALQSRAMSPLTDEDREQLSHDARVIQRNLTALLDLSDEIVKAARKIRDAPVDANLSQPVLPQSLQGLLGGAEEAAQRFCNSLSTPEAQSLERSSNETIVGYLSRVLEEKKRIKDESDAFVAEIQKIKDEVRASAEAAGHTDRLQFLRDYEGILNRVAARRNTSINITNAAIDTLADRLSLSEKGVNALDGIVRHLNGIRARLEEQRALLGSMATDAVHERQAEEAATEADLPEWNAIVNARKGDGSKLAGLDMLIAAFRDDAGDEEAFGKFTREELKERLNDLFPDKAPFSDSWVYRHLLVAVDRKIVVKPPDEGKSRSLPDIFVVAAAAIRYYRPHLPRS